MNSVMNLLTIYEKLLAFYGEIIVLETISSNLNWDIDTFMPKAAIDQKSKQLELITELIHKRKTSSIMGELLEEIIGHSYFIDLDYVKQRNVELIKREYDKLTKVPEHIEKDFTKQKTITYEKWQIARKRNNFRFYEDEQDKLVKIIKERAHYLNPNKNPLEVLMDIQEPGLTLQKLNASFDELKSGLLPIVSTCVNSSNQPDLTLINRVCLKNIQYQIALDQAVILGYTNGRIDTSVHPITYAYYDDTRITTRYNENNFTESFYSIMHEIGHALYGQNYPLEFKYQPIGTASSGGMHEAMARFVENMIGRSTPFWEFYFPRFQKITGNIYSDVKLDEFIHAVNKVEPSKFRVGADEVTYTLHLIFRMEIEKALFDEKIAVSELPIVWNQKMREYFDIDIQNDKEGVLQDMHWPYAAFGYFPNFAFGNIYDGQLFWKMTQELHDWKESIQEGKLITIISWLKKNIYQNGCLYDSPELIKRITGKEVSSKYFLNYLKDKYSQLYHS
ncbi:MAG: carboxypeptidase M32 [Candidatus Heimdallarchaeota archaeon]|nr:carboxypeptidase M32 [Candidatus Heimdallarchaeota archaeon]